MKETGLAGKRRSTTIAATPDDGNSQRKRRRPNNIHSSIRLFADDCVLYREIKNENDSQELQKDLNSLMKWEYDCQMHFNPQNMFCNETNTC